MIIFKNNKPRGKFLVLTRTKWLEIFLTKKLGDGYSKLKSMYASPWSHKLDLKIVFLKSIWLLMLYVPRLSSSISTQCFVKNSDRFFFYVLSNKFIICWYSILYYILCFLTFINKILSFFWGYLSFWHFSMKSFIFCFTWDCP